MLLGRMKRWCLKTLLESIPTWLHSMLENYGVKVGLLRNSQAIDQRIKGDERRVYDLVNCGPMNRFMVGPLRPMIVHNCQYGAGVKKILQTLELDNVFLSFDEVEQIHSGYWNLFSKLADFGKSLHYEWKRNGGYILNGLGRPMAVAQKYSKDLLNRFVQSTGHDLLVRYISIVDSEMSRREIPYRPLIVDFHDATTLEVPEQFGEATAQCLVDCLGLLNAEVQGTIQIRGVPVIGRTLADCKEPES